MVEGLGADDPGRYSVCMRWGPGETDGKPGSAAPLSSAFSPGDRVSRRKISFWRGAEP
jgi:hypothetical protein